MEFLTERPELALLMGGMLLLIFMLRKQATAHFRRAARAGDDRPRAGAITQASAADASPELARWEVHLRETARELSAQLDSKMVALQHLIRQAREEQSRLQRLLKSQRRRHDAS
jgi:hypothetical protein